MLMRAVTISRTGDADVLETVELGRPTAGPGKVLVRLSVAGVNYMDVYQRTGTVPVPTPFVAGVEGVGRVVAVGDGVADLTEGQRIGWFSGGQGSYAEFAAIDATRAVPLPDGVTDEEAAAVLMQGITAQYLATDAYPVKSGDTVLVHAAAGGVGQLLTQIVLLRGGRVIGTVSSEAKADAARAAGADEVITYDDFAAKVRRLTDGEGVAAVYDGVGRTTFDGSLASLRPRGTLLVYGTASGPTPALEIPRLNSGGSLYVTRPSLVHYTAAAAELRGRAEEVLGWVAGKELRVSIGGTYGFGDARQAQDDLESRQTTGKLLLLP
jgi:NADPH2:quinone reductase